MLSVSDRHLAQQLAANNAIIIRKKRADAYPAYAYGDRRKRPLRWVSDESFRCLTSFGGLDSKGSGYSVSKSFMRRLKGEDHAGQHRAMEERELYIDGGVKRPVSMNTKMNALERLCVTTDRSGEPLLTSAQQEAGRRLAKDYARSGQGYVGTQNYESAGADKTGYDGSVEDAQIKRLDAAARLTAAKAAMGEGLDKAVIAVCCHDHQLDQVERAENWASGSGLTLLTMGLMRLVKHYGTAAGR